MLSRRYDERGSASHRALARDAFDWHRHARVVSIECRGVALQKTPTSRARACNERIIIGDNALRYKIGSRCAGT